MPIRRSTPSVHRLSRATKGRVAVDNQFMGRATRRASDSGYICPSRLGTSSPKMMVMMVMVTTTSAVAPTAAVCWAMPKNFTSQVAKGAAKAASPTMPLSTPMDVMPICTVDKNLVGLSCRSIAACAPGSPLSTMTCKRALRLALSAISDMANRPLSRIKKMSSERSMCTAGNVQRER